MVAYHVIPILRKLRQDSLGPVSKKKTKILTTGRVEV
jgi:hypothetical protein